MRCRTLHKAGVAWIAALILAVPVHAADTPPDVLVKTTTEEVLTVIRDNPDPDKLLKVAESKVLPHFDFRRMTQLAVGRYWRQATPDQQHRLEKEFRDLLVRTYTNALASGAHKDVAVQVKPFRMQSGDTEVTVRTEVVQPGRPPIPIDYRMAKAASGWKVFDVAVENVSLVTNYRESFAAEIKQSGIDGLIEALAQKNKAPSGSRLGRK